jgi:hypothetical protein
VTQPHLYSPQHESGQHHFRHRQRLGCNDLQHDHVQEALRFDDDEENQ